MNNNLKTYKVITFGCQMNARDSEKLSGVLENNGFIYEDDENIADIVIFNTCTVRENANKKLYGNIGQLKNSYMKNKNKIIGICGCMMQEKEEVEYITKKYPYVKLIFGTHNIDEFDNLLLEVLDTKNKIIKVYDEAKNVEKKLPIKRVYNFKCGINIMFGCDNFCTYCIVPYVRGRERSRDVDIIINEIKEAVSDGVIEVMLLGQNVNSYKGIKNIDGKIKNYTFPMLLEEICKIEGLKRIRFMTSHPKDLSNELIDVIKNNDKICKHIHLPIQSGSDKILKSMNRKYTATHYLEVIKNIRDNIKNVAISTDIIVGFPGESDDDFNDTLDIIKKVKFDSVFTFEYSKRSGTIASNMENQIKEEVVKERFNRLLKTVEETASINCDSLVGNIYEALIESYNENTKIYTGRLSNNYLVHFQSEENLIGKIVNVKLEKSHKFYFEGVLCNN